MKHKSKKKHWQKVKLRKKRQRKHLLPVAKCLHLNKKFPESNAHHMNFNIVVFLPVLLHQHIQHNLKSGVGMTEMNLLAMQYLYGEI